MAPRLSLLPHPDTPPDRVTKVEVEIIADPADDILLTFFVSDASALKLADWSSSVRRDGLWETTCFELFLKPTGGTAYYEYNFSASTEWASYRFEGHRAGRSDFHQPVDPFIERYPEDEGSTIEVDVDLSGLPNIPMRMGVSAVIEEVSGRKSYWALAHAPGEPDFHNEACFVLELPAAAKP